VNCSLKAPPVAQVATGYVRAIDEMSTCESLVFAVIDFIEQFTIVSFTFCVAEHLSILGRLLNMVITCVTGIPVTSQCG